VKRWKTKLQQTLSRLQRDNKRLRIAVLGVGQELRGDDALGVIAVRRMMQTLRAPAELLLIEAGPMPENFCAQLRRFQPDLVLIIDAAALGQAPGTIAWIEAHEAGGHMFSTHSLPLGVVLGYLASEANCETAILGVQPAELAFGVPLSVDVNAAIDTLISDLRGLLWQEVA